MHEMTPSVSTLVQFFEESLADVKQEDKLSTLQHENSLNEKSVQGVTKEKLILTQIMSIPCALTKDGFLMTDILHRVQTVFENEEGDLCVVIFDDSYLNYTKYVKVMRTAYDQLIAFYEEHE